ncbi:MAG: hypothetical protein KJ783_12540 [Actinobacteria bacterium]|nr:hypothetical protein [Actinomycetota bacterium]
MSMTATVVFSCEPPSLGSGDPVRSLGGSAFVPTPELDPGVGRCVRLVQQPTDRSEAVGVGNDYRNPRLGAGWPRGTSSHHLGRTWGSALREFR